MKAWKMIENFEEIKKRMQRQNIHSHIFNFFKRFKVCSTYMVKQLKTLTEPSMENIENVHEKRKRHLNKHCIKPAQLPIWIDCNNGSWDLKPEYCKNSSVPAHHILNFNFSYERWSALYNLVWSRFFLESICFNVAGTHSWSHLQVKRLFENIWATAKISRSVQTTFFTSHPKSYLFNHCIGCKP